MMNTWSDSVVTLATRLSDHFGPVVNLIDRTTDRLLGKHTAKTCTGMFCTAKCFVQLNISVEHVVPDLSI